MSKPNETPISVVPSDENSAVIVKQNPVKRGVNFVKSHKKAALAAAGLVVLVVASAALGRESASHANESSDEITDADLEAFIQAETEANYG